MSWEKHQTKTTTETKPKQMQTKTAAQKIHNFQGQSSQI